MRILQKGWFYEQAYPFTMIGAHPDNCIFAAAVWLSAHGQVFSKFLSMDGGGGHHEMKRHEIAARRKRKL